MKRGTGTSKSVDTVICLLCFFLILLTHMKVELDFPITTSKQPAPFSGHKNKVKETSTKLSFAPQNTP